MNLILLNILPDDIIDLIYSKVYYTQSKELLQDIINFKLAKERINHLSDTNIISNLYEINKYYNIKIPKIPIYISIINDYSIRMIINMYLAKNKIETRNKIVYFLTSS
tara:strand:- start:50 stop:373 length:324 start_codon:yes stop_codon:yes gene_type:complete